MPTKTTIRNAPVTRAALLEAMRECDALGEDAFLQKHGYAKSAKYTLRHRGRSYPSKAIVGVAAGLAASDFSGGKKSLGALLERLGFKLGVLAFAFAAKRVIDAAHQKFRQQTCAAGTELDACYYASGSTRPGHAAGFAAINQAFMVTATEMSETVENVLYHVAEETDVKVAVDSGAFTRSKINFPAKNGKIRYPELPIGIHCEKPFTPEEWQEIFDLYNRLGAVFGDRLMVVAPDQVGFQVETLELIERYASEISSLLDLGVDVMIVAQKGALSQVEFDRRARELLGRTDYVRGLPCNKAATTLEEIRAFAAEVRPAKLHLLGMGLRNKDAARAAAAVHTVSPKTQLSYDSCLINESVGYSNGRANHPYETADGPRVFTAAKEAAKRLIATGDAVTADLHDLAVRLAWGPTPASA